MFGFAAEKGIKSVRRSHNSAFNDYDGFVDKFKPKKTTDDCYTPPEVYSAVVDYVKETTGIGDRPIVRPFYPGGDFEHYDYPDNCVVIDNPPFSIFTKILRFYTFHGIDFFLFAPHLTLFVDVDCTFLPAYVDIIYHNGAKVKTAFATSLTPEYRIIVDWRLKKRIEDAQEHIKEKEKNDLPRYILPDNVVTAARLGKIVREGITIKVRKDEAQYCRCLDGQRESKTKFFGGGFIVSDKAAAEKAAAEKAAADKAAADKAAEREAIVWGLSAREKAIIATLNAHAE